MRVYKQHTIKKSTSTKQEKVVLGLRVAIIIATVVLILLMTGISTSVSRTKIDQSIDPLLTLIFSTVKTKPRTELTEIILLVIEASKAQKLNQRQIQAIFTAIRNDKTLIDSSIVEFSTRVCDAPTDNPCIIVEALVRDALSGNLANQQNAEAKNELIEQLRVLQKAKTDNDVESLKVGFRKLLNYFKEYYPKLLKKLEEQKAFAVYLPEEKVNTVTSIRKALEMANVTPQNSSTDSQP